MVQVFHQIPFENAVWHALNEPVCQNLRTRNPCCSTVYKYNSLGPLARESPCINSSVAETQFFLSFTLFRLLKSGGSKGNCLRVTYGIKGRSNSLL